jgi:two-component system nitrate/nitrite response regulator NarL
MSITETIPQDDQQKPISNPQSRMSFHQVPALPPMYPRRIMIVEDNPTHSRQIQNAVEKWGVVGTLHLCPTGEDVFKLLETPKFGLDLALIDLGLPDISGIEVIKRLRRAFPELPIMVISSISTERSVLSAIRAGARGYILKDDSEYVIAHAIAQVLMGHYPITPSLAHALFKLAGSPAAADLGDLQFKLSPRELETLQFISQGFSYEEVGRKMGIALTTVQSNIRSLYRKLDAHSQGQAVSKARAAGLI